MIQPTCFRLQHSKQATASTHVATAMDDLTLDCAALSQELNEATLERLKSDDAVSAFFAQLGEQYPQLLAPLVHERDLYLAWSMKRSKAVNGTKRVVGVVGKVSCHLGGIRPCNSCH